MPQAMQDAGGHAPRRQLIPYAGKEPPPFRVADGTVIDGVDCSGMMDDPKKEGIPVYLQTQNRKGLTPEQKALVDAIVAESRAVSKRARKFAGSALGALGGLTETDQAAIRSLRKAGAEIGKVGMSPMHMRKAGAEIRSTRDEPGKSKAPGAATMARRASAGRKGSKTELIAALLRRPEGCTTADVLAACHWPSVSMPQQAGLAGIQLRKVKDGKVTRYYAVEPRS